MRPLKIFLTVILFCLSLVSFIIAIGSFADSDLGPVVGIVFLGICCLSSWGGIKLIKRKTPTIEKTEFNKHRMSISDDETYRLKYSDAEGKVTNRQIEIEKISIGKTLTTSYIHAYCLLVNDSRTFRFDRIKALYKGNEKIKDPVTFLKEKYGKHDVSALVAEAMEDPNK